jgi:hypothetical protein
LQDDGGEELTDCVREAPFTYAAWNSPVVLHHLSAIAGLDLVPALDIEIGHCNVSVKDDDDDDNHGNKAVLGTNGASAFGWHFDSYAFVCVLMLSDCTGMTGGETAIRCGDGAIIKARGPSMVCFPNHHPSRTAHTADSPRAPPFSCRAGTLSTRRSPPPATASASP